MEEKETGFIMAQMREEIAVLESEYAKLVKELSKIRIRLNDKKKAYAIWFGKKQKKDGKKEEAQETTQQESKIS